jgi:hypothetical protein
MLAARKWHGTRCRSGNSYGTRVHQLLEVVAKDRLDILASLQIGPAQCELE